MCRLKSTLSPQDYSRAQEVQSLEQLRQSSSEERAFYDRQRLPRFMEKCGPFLEHLLTFSGVIDTFVSSDPKVSGLIWGSLKLVLEAGRS